MMDQIWTIVAVLLTIPYFVLPIFVRRSHYLVAEPQVTPVLDGCLPQSAKNYFNACGAQLKKFNFEHRIDVVSHHLGPGIRVFMRFFVEKRRSIIATASTLVAGESKESKRDFIEFSSLFDDGQEVSTHNSRMVGTPIEPRNKFTSALPRGADIDSMMAIHIHALAGLKRAPTTVSVVPKAGDEVQFLVDGFLKDLEGQASLGCLKLDPENKIYRATWSGSILIAWASLWPMGIFMRVWQDGVTKYRLRSFQRIRDL